MTNFEAEKFLRARFTPLELSILMRDEEFRRRRDQLQSIHDLPAFCRFASDQLEKERKFYPLKFPVPQV